MIVYYYLFAFIVYIGIGGGHARNFPLNWKNNLSLKRISQIILLPSAVYFSVSSGNVIADTAEFQKTANMELSIPSTTVVDSMKLAKPLNSDEFLISFDESSLGLGLVESNYKGFPVVTVSAIKKTDLVVNHRELRIGAIVTAVGDQSTDGVPLTSIIKLVENSPRPVEIKFRDPSRFLFVIIYDYFVR
jgi:hypothetical protein